MKTKTIISFVLIFILTFLSIGFVVACKSNDDIAFCKAADSKDGYAYVVKPNNRDLKILQLTDIHLENWITGHESIWNKLGVSGNNASTLVLIDKLLEAVSPDIIIITGDAVRSWANDNLEMYSRIADVIEQHGILWIPIFGNHEAEYEFEKKQHNHTELAAALSLYPHCLMSDTSNAAVGEYFVNIKDKRNKILYSLCAMGTYYDRSLIDDDFGSGWSYNRTSAQIDWYESNIKSINELRYGRKDGIVPSMLFAHIPVPEVITAWDEAFDEDKSNANYYYGNLLSGASSFRNHLGEDKLFQKAIELGSTKAMFFGHYHDNDFSVEYQGIRLTAGQMSTNNMDYRLGVKQNNLLLPTEVDLSKLNEFGDNRGGTIITIGEKGTFSVSQALAREVIPDYDEWKFDYDNATATLISLGITVIT